MGLLWLKLKSEWHQNPSLLPLWSRRTEEFKTDLHLRNTDSLGKTLRLRKVEGRKWRGWDGWMASPIQWTWTWANFRRWWGTEKPSVLLSMGLWRAGHDSATKQQQRLGGLPGGSVVKNLPANARRCRRHEFDPWVRKIPWRKKWQLTPVFLSGKSHGQRAWWV